MEKDDVRETDVEAMEVVIPEDCLQCVLISLSQTVAGLLLRLRLVGDTFGEWRGGGVF